MSTGLSMASVNKIKELANQREYSLALEIVDSQDLSKSLNPQFLRLCGDIFSHAKRYKDARKVLLMAHRLAPESKRIIASMVELYLSVGYKELAQKYYDIYMFDADENTIETKQVKYAYDNAHRKEPAWLLSYLEATFHHNMDYEWSYKTYLLLKAVNRDNDAKALADIYLPTYKNTEFADIIETIENDGGSTEERIYVYARQWIEDDAEDEQELRSEEEKLLEADELRIHPKEAEITIMFEEMGDGTEELSKRKLKKLMKEQEKEAKLTEENGEQEVEDEPAKEQEKGLFKKLFKKNKKAEPDTETEKNTEAKKQEVENTETEKAEVEHIENVEVEKTDTESIESEKPETEQPEEEGAVFEADKAIEEEKSETEQPKIENIEVEDKKDTENGTTEEISNETSSRSRFKFVIEDAEIISNTDILDVDDEIIEEQDSEAKEPWGSNESNDEDTDMRELHLKGRESKTGLVVSVDEDFDDFTAESETIDDLSGDADYSNPFESISAIKKEKEEHRFMPKRKAEFVFEEAQLSDSEADDSDIDEFVSDEVDDEFGQMEVAEEEISLDTEDAESKDFEFDFGTEQETSFEPEAEKDVETADFEANETKETETVNLEIDERKDVETETANLEIETEKESDSEDFEFDFGIEPKTSVEVEKEVQSEAVSLEIDETKEAETETANLEIDETKEAETETASLEIDETKEAETETVNVEIETEKESDSEDFEFDFGIEPKTSIEVEKEVQSEAVSLEINETKEAETETANLEAAGVKETEATDSKAKTEKEVEKTSVSAERGTKTESKPDYSFMGQEYKPKKKLDFPVFKSSLFPEHNKEIKDVENNFHELMEEAQDKMQENLLKEEQMQKEAEALLASLGIDLGSVEAKPTDNSMVKAKAVKLEDDKASRDALKASLKIDSVKRDTLRKLKEYR